MRAGRGAGGLRRARLYNKPYKREDYSLDWQEALCDFQHTHGCVISNTHTHEHTRGSGRCAATTMPMLRAVTSTRELDGAVPVLHEDVAHAPLPQPRVEDLCMRAGGLPVPNRVWAAASSLFVVVVVVYAICFST